MVENSEQKIGISLSDIKTTARSANTTQTAVSDLVAYRHDMRRSLLIGGLAILVEVGIYLSGVLR